MSEQYTKLMPDDQILKGLKRESICTVAPERMKLYGDAYVRIKQQNSRIAELEARNAELEGVVEKYADRENWGYYDESGCPKGYGQYTDACFIGPEPAEAARGKGGGVMMYTEQEKRVLWHLAKAWDNFVSMDDHHPSAIGEFCAGTHALQHQVMARLASRCEPDIHPNQQHHAERREGAEG